MGVPRPVRALFGARRAAARRLLLVLVVLFTGVLAHSKPEPPPTDARQTTGPKVRFWSSKARTRSSQTDQSEAALASSTTAAAASGRQRLAATGRNGGGGGGGGPTSGQRPQSGSHRMVQQAHEPMQVSITPRVGLVRVPVDSNAILKCLVSAQTEKFTRRFKMHWSRYLYEENVHEQIETTSALADENATDQTDDNGDDNAATAYAIAANATNTADDESQMGRRRRRRAARRKRRRRKRSSAAAAAPSGVGRILTSRSNDATTADDDDDDELGGALNRQQELREFLLRSRQEINTISDLLIEATLAISPVKATDNATYYCTATDGRHTEQAQARVDLVALSRPVVRLERVEAARDSRSALVHWTVISEGNTPIKRTILMARNDSATLRGAPSDQRQFKWSQAVSAAAAAPDSDANNDADGSHAPASTVVDSERQQWQRYDIEADGAEWPPVQSLGGGGGGGGGGAIGSALGPPQRAMGGQILSAAHEDDDHVVRAGSDAAKSADGSMNGHPNNSSMNQSDNQSSAGLNRWLNGGGGGGGGGAQLRPTSLRRRNNKRAFNLTQLLPGVTYQLRLAAINDMGQSEWSQLASTMPNEIPAQINEVFLLSRSNDSLMIGWRRPAFDNAKTTRYEMQLFDLNRTLTLDASTSALAPSSAAAAANSSSSSSKPVYKTNFMYVFVNLKPGTDYHFHVRACSRAGCGPYSQPKLAAATLDGEPDEPIDVELACNERIGNLTVSWLPPANVRGQLLNYTVTLESRAHYRNQSGQWTWDEWRTSFETPDNHTLSIDYSANLLRPNTNYTARVCANNRSRNGCGRQSLVSARSQCSTSPTLPAQMPQNIRLQMRPLQDSPSANAGRYPTLKQRSNAETLVLEMPFVSWRNGSIDCIQVILIRLPKSFDARKRRLDEYLPQDPSKIQVHNFVDLMHRSSSSSSSSSSPPPPPPPPPLSDDNDEPAASESGTGSGSGALAAATTKGSQTSARMASNGANTTSQLAAAYLAEELEQASQPSEAELESGMQQVTLGDGAQQVCESVRRRATGDSIASNVAAFDGSLHAQTYYTGFLRLIQVRADAAADAAAAGQPVQRDTQTTESSSSPPPPSQLERYAQVQSAYSAYFEPIKTGDFMLEIVAASGGGERSRDHSSAAAAAATSFGLLAGAESMVGNLFGQSSRVYVAELSREAGARLDALYRSAAALVDARARFDSLSKLIMRSSPPMQLLEIGLLVLVLSLVILLVIYLLSLPVSMRRRRRRRKRSLAAGGRAKAKERPAAEQSPLAQESGNEIMMQTGHCLGANGQVNVDYAAAHQMMRTHNDLNHVSNAHALNYIGQQQPPAQQVAAECPIHSSPQVHAQVAAQYAANDANYAAQQQSQLYQQQQQPPSSSSATTQPSAQVFPVQRYHSRGAGQAVDGQSATGAAQFAVHAHWHHARAAPSEAGTTPDALFERQCRTLRRMPQVDAGGAGADDEQHQWAQHRRRASQTQVQLMSGQQQQQQPHQLAAFEPMLGQSLHALNAADAAKHLTLAHARSSVMGLAKRINKSIPVALFRAVFEARLRNGWLRDEYDQLPSEQLRPTGAAAHRHGTIRLRPQLIVSRDDSMSALISGNDHYDASLLRVPMPPTGATTTTTTTTTPIGHRDRDHSTSATDNDADKNGHKDRDEVSCSVAGERRFICARSPLDADSVWDFWRLVYEQEVSSLVMLTPCEDASSGELKCVQYWPTSDNEETTILSPCNEYVQASSILPAKFKIRQETLVEGVAGDAAAAGVAAPNGTKAEFVVRKLTLMVMGTRAREHETTSATTTATTPATSAERQQVAAAAADTCGGAALKTDGRAAASGGTANGCGANGASGAADELTDGANDAAAANTNGDDDNDDDDADDERYVIVEREILHFQFAHWNASSAQNRRRLLRFVEFVNERHLSAARAQMSPGAWPSQSAPPLLAHCSNGLGRSGLFVCMSVVLGELRARLAIGKLSGSAKCKGATPKVNLFAQVARLRQQRDMLLSPYRFYELLYQLTADSIPRDLSFAVVGSSGAMDTPLDSMSAANAQQTSQRIVQQHLQHQPTHHNH